jgi:hypothetical protein
MPSVSARENNRLSEQNRLDSLKTALERNKLGQFATPPALALEIARYARTLLKGCRAPIRFLDPAIGTGSFYAAMLDTFPTKRVAAAAGIELDGAFANAAAEIWGPTGLAVIRGDFTRQPEPQQRFNVILTNPPYVRHHHLNGEDKPRLRELVYRRLGIDVSGLAGLYCYFLLLADSWLDAGGLGVWLIPSEFMDVNYGAALKRYLTERVTLRRIHRFCPSDVQFDDALVSSAVVAFTKSPPPSSHAAEFSFGGSLAKPAQAQLVPIDNLRGRLKWTAYPNAGLIERTDEPTLGDLFTIKRGLATGNNSFFIKPRAEATQLGIPKDCLRPILPSPRYLSDSIIETDQDGYPRITNPLALIDCKLSEDEIERQHPRFWKYLEQGKRNAVHAGYLASRREPWYSQERREPAPFVCTYMGRMRGASGKPFRFIWNQSKATAANVYLMLYPRAELQKALDSEPTLYARVFAALNEIEGRAFTSEGRVYGGGLHKMEPAELSRIPVGKLSAAVGIRQKQLRQLLAFT